MKTFSYTALLLCAGLLLAQCATEKQIEGFDYRCFERCHQHGQTDRACVQECTDQQSTRGQEGRL